MIRPYLEILKVCMGAPGPPSRCQTALLSAEFPPMMIQGLVENAIRHGLEPKAEGGSLTVKAEVVHGKLARPWPTPASALALATSGFRGGPGLSVSACSFALRRQGQRHRHREPSGTVVTITVPHRSREADAA